MQKPVPGATSIQARERMRGYLYVCLAALAVITLAIAPVSAGTKVMAGSPQLDAHIASTNEFSPGDDVNLQVVIGNTGLNQFMIVESGYITPVDLSNTAKQLTATLDAGDAPLVVKADPQIMGDLPASATATAIFHITVNKYAAAGTYQLPVILNYTYLYQANQEGDETLNYQYKTVNETISIPITIKPEVQVAVSNVEAENLNAGIEGYVFLTVKNVGSDNGQNAVIRIQQNGQSPIVPTDGSFYVGDYPIGSTVNCTFRAQISSDAQQKTYPLDVLVYYKNYEGDYVDSPIETVGVPVNTTRPRPFAPCAIPGRGEPPPHNSRRGWWRWAEIRYHHQHPGDVARKTTL